ncbi:methyltransferase family protein [Phaeacidiphilus oryzae]|uniref:methyltransferase family protein n=1 Tax=Phaeacidiphilus oryzae TaxID=348818 RepID=UPI00055C43C5|nr:isoprenylcysteine carboxylmethyltransferase family protein [Phaeacidiphilus oryzae]
MSSLHSALTTLTWVCILVFVAAWILGAIWFGLRSPGGGRSRPGGRRRALVSRLALVLGIALVIRLTSGAGGGSGPGFGFGSGTGAGSGVWRHLTWWQPAVAVTGALLAVAATALLLWARWTLGVMWTSVPTVQEHHELVTTGPYRIVRHPIYTGLLALILGAMLAHGFGVWLVYFGLAVPWLLRRVRVEDRLMAGRFGERYRAYRAEVPALLPYPRPGR